MVFLSTCYTVEQRCFLAGHERGGAGVVRIRHAQLRPLPARLRRSGWSTGEATFTGLGGRTLVQVDGTNGENRIKVVGVTQRQAWHRAVEAAAACGMLEGWPRPGVRKEQAWG
jgi:hypothetical protein